VLHVLVRTWARLIRVLSHGLIARVSHGVHRLVLLHRRSVHGAAALSVVQLWRSMHRRLLWVGRLLWWSSVLLHVVLL